MKAYKFRIDDYVSSMPGAQDTTVNVREMMAMILLAPRLELSAPNAIKNHSLATRIMATQEPTILLDADDRARICAARDALTGWSWADIELLQRIDAMEEVEVEEKPC